LRFSKCTLPSAVLTEGFAGVPPAFAEVGSLIVGGVMAGQEVADKIGADVYVRSAFDVVQVLNDALEKARTS